MFQAFVAETSILRVTTSVIAGISEPFEQSTSVGAKLQYMGYFASLLHPQGRKIWFLFRVRDMSGGLRNPCFTKFSVVNFL